MESVCELLRTMAKGLLCWYEFKERASILYIGDEADPIVEFLKEKLCKITVASGREYCGEKFIEEKKHSFDYIIAILELERDFEPQEKLKCMKKLLAQEGTLLLGANNRLGIRYFCGDRDNYSGNCLDGIDNYVMLSKEEWEKLEGKNYSKAELSRFIEAAGFVKKKFYSVFPNLETPQHIFAEDYMPNEEMSTRIFPLYYDKENLFIKEELLYNDLIENGLFHSLANGFIIECSDVAQLSDVNNVTCALDRDRKNAQLTIIKRSGIVEKMAIFEEGRAKYGAMLENAKELGAYGVKVLDAQIIKGRYVMPFVAEKNAEMYLRQLALEGQIEKFIAEMDRFREKILHSSECVKDDEDGVVLKKAFVDMVPVNCFVIDGEFVFYDQEFYKSDYPANMIVYRFVDMVYSNDKKMERMVPMCYFMERYGLADKSEHWKRMSVDFWEDLTNRIALKGYYSEHMVVEELVETNRRMLKICMNVANRNVFRGFCNYVKDKKLIIFGTGKYAKSYFERYGELNPPLACIDNNPEKQGAFFCGTPVYGADYLKSCRSDDYRIIICVKDYGEIVNQLEAFGIDKNNIRVFAPNPLIGV